MGPNPRIRSWPQDDAPRGAQEPRAGFPEQFPAPGAFDRNLAQQRHAFPGASPARNLPAQAFDGVQPQAMLQWRGHGGPARPDYCGSPTSSGVRMGTGSPYSGGRMGTDPNMQYVQHGQSRNQTRSPNPPNHRR